VERNPDLRQAVAQAAIVDPVLAELFSARGVLPGNHQRETSFGLAGSLMSTIIKIAPK